MLCVARHRLWGAFSIKLSTSVGVINDTELGGYICTQTPHNLFSPWIELPLSPLSLLPPSLPPSLRLSYSYRPSTLPPPLPLIPSVCNTSVSGTGGVNQQRSTYVAITFGVCGCVIVHNIRHMYIINGQYVTHSSRRGRTTWLVHAQLPTPVYTAGISHTVMYIHTSHCMYTVCGTLYEQLCRVEITIVPTYIYMYIAGG